MHVLGSCADYAGSSARCRYSGTGLLRCRCSGTGTSHDLVLPLQTPLPSPFLTQESLFSFSPGRSRLVLSTNYCRSPRLETPHPDALLPPQASCLLFKTAVVTSPFEGTAPRIPVLLKTVLALSEEPLPFASSQTPRPEPLSPSPDLVLPLQDPRCLQEPRCHARLLSRPQYPCSKAVLVLSQELVPLASSRPPVVLL
jgi:hypothetical protein